MEDIEYLYNKVKEEKAEIARLEYKKSLDDFSDKLYCIYDSLCNAGFTDEQAWTVTLEFLKSKL